MFNADEPKVVKAAEGPVSVAVSASPGAQDNHVYFYEEVNGNSCQRLIQQLKEVDLRLRTERIQRDLPESFVTPIKLHLRTPGGSVLDALHVYDHILKSRTPIYTYIEGIVASAGTIISIAGSQRYITPNSYALIHQFTTFSWGTYEQMKDDQKMNDDLIDRMRRVYTDRTKMKYEKVVKLLKHDYWMNAEEAKKLGLVDHIE